MKTLATALAVFGSLLCSAANAKTFVGVLWPMGGPLPAIGLVELVAEIKKMPDVEVETYLHQSWRSLVKDIDRQPPGTRTVVVGYSLGANNSTFVANNAKAVDLIIALQPSMLSWNPPVHGNVGRMIEIYNPNPWMTFGGMGSKKLVGDNIEYIANNDSHPGAQFSSQFRNLVKGEITKMTTQERIQTAQASAPKPQPKLTQVATATAATKPADQRPTRRQREPDTRLAFADTTGSIARTAKADESDEIASYQPQRQPDGRAAFLDRLSRSVDSGDLFAQRRLTEDAMARYAQRRLTVDAIARYAQRTYRPAAARGDRLLRTASD